MCIRDSYGGSVCFTPAKHEYQRYSYKHEGHDLFTTQIVSIDVYKRQQSGETFDAPLIPRRSHPAQSGETFDGPPTLERSGSEHRVCLLYTSVFGLPSQVWNWNAIFEGKLKVGKRKETPKDREFFLMNEKQRCV